MSDGHAQGALLGRAMRLWLAFGALLAIAYALSGCALPDQQTFGARAYRGPPAPKPVAQKPPPSPWLGATPLVTIRFADLNADYVGPLRAAVHAAEARKPDVVFAVVGIAPGGGTIAAQVAKAANAAKTAQTVMSAIERMGVPSRRILLASRTDPSASAEQVEIFVH